VLSALGWSTPNFQEEPKLVLAIVCLFVSAHILRPVRAEKLTLAFGALFCLLLQDRSQGIFLAFAAMLFAEAVHRHVPSRWFVTISQPTAVTMAFASFAAVFGALLIGTQRHSTPYEIHALRGALSDPLYGQGSCRLFHDIKYGEDLSAFGLPRCLEPDFQGRSRIGMSYGEYEKLMSLAEGYEEILKSRAPAAALLNRDSALAGVLIERNHWSVRAQTEPLQSIDRGLPRLSPIVLLRPPAR